MTLNQQDQHHILEAFSRTLGREMHVLNQRPDLLWQQMYNRLQWLPEINERLENFRDKHTLPWLKNRRPYQESRELIRTLKGHQGSVTSIALNTDGKLLVSASSDGTLKTWDVRTGINRETMRGHNGPVLCCAFHPDGNGILSGGRDGLLKFWQANTGELLLNLTGKGGEVLTCAIDPIGHVAASGGSEGAIHIWDLTTGKKIRTLNAHLEKINACVFSPDGRWVASGSSDRSIHLWNWKSGETVALFKGHQIPVTCCRISPNSKKLLSASHMALHVWEIDQPQDFIKVDLSGLYKSFSSCDIAPDGSYLVLGTDEGLLHILSGGDGRNLKKINKEYDPNWLERVWSRGSNRDIVHLSSPDKKLSISGSKEYLLDFLAGGTYGKSTLIESGLIPAKLVGSLRGHSKKVTSCLVCPDGRTIISCSEDGKIKIWGMDLSHRFSEQPGNDTEIRQCQYSPDGKTIYASGGRGTLDVIDASSGEFQTTFRRNSAVIGEFHKWALDPQGYRLVSADVNHYLKVWDAGMQREIDNLSMKNPEGPIGDLPKDEVYGFTFSPDGRVLVTLSKEMSDFGMGESMPFSERIERSTRKQLEITLWDMVSGKKLAVHRDDYVSPGQVCFHPNGRRILVKHRNGIQVCDAQTAKPLRLIGDEMLPDIFQINPDGKMLIVSVGNFIQIWDFDRGEKRHTLRDNPLDFKKIAARFQNGMGSPDEYQSIDMEPLHWLNIIAVAPLGNLVAAGTTDGWVTIWDLESGEMKWQVRDLPGGITKLIFSRDGKQLISANQDNWLYSWDSETGKEVVAFPFLGEARSVQSHPYLNQILTGDTTGTIYLLDLLGVKLKGIIVYPFDAGEGYILRCPSCGTEYPINSKQLDNVFICNTQGCCLKMIPIRALIPNPQPASTQVKTVLSTKSKQPSKVTPSITRDSRSSETPAKEKSQFESYRRAAEKGDSNAQMMLGTMYASGKGVTRDLKEAASWYCKAADVGNASAQMLLGTCYAYGNGVPKDAFKAVDYYRKAAQAGNRMAQYKLGECYAKGQGVPRDEGQAILWYRKAADQNFSLAKTKFRALEAKQDTSQPSRLTTQSSGNPSRQPKSTSSPVSDRGRIKSSGDLGKQAALLKTQGDLNSALKLFKEQEKILREKKDLRALNINLSQQSEILKALLKDIDGKIKDKLKKNRKK